MGISAADVKELREKTNAGILDCKKALTETDGDMDAAVKYLREKGIADAEKKAGRTAAEGLVDSYIHMGGKIGVLLEVNCETDFVAKNEAFKELVNNIAMHIAAANPAYLSREDVSEDVIAKEKEVLKTQALNDGKPEHIVEQIVEGRLNKFYSQNCLLEQPYIRDDEKTVQELITEKIAELGENINIRRFTRYELGEGIEVEEEDFAAEVMNEVEK
ncbi:MULTISPECIES: translation elongation factor Ts [unclassified Candidatus Frackibacter]|uniref:translation elongation factor Ts n=1 Tax=unclassified Candidatus Frackibacter TaxID=2648818 RepID=UPI00079601E6|nr:MULTISPECIES: translation elongation factor Ts [unclassified Candidatus Frackibacter]KXS40232.1 MAG: elongation factor T [Candidatus Frackibacter sp. T328-2]SDB98894.1 translation elongation factor Ts (EF-Ts) [Candidatus Frackibacter sp. WG11]SEM30655.1 translation elongation factor Ts (EF-Ts) [Candidatus Frackibacter sp. WG12]SFL35589.1 translation elongation factor Ts (EF-Ts) [Candidatus Frackibacter sp. WG13]